LTPARALLLALASFAPTALADNAAPSTEASVRAALAPFVASDQRPADQKKRDPYRHPLDTLAFFGIKPDQTVVEIWPSGGWYTEILAPYLKDKGHYIAAVRPGKENKDEEAYNDKFVKHPERYGKIAVTELDPPKSFAIAPPGSADYVLTFRNLHNWMKGGNQAKVFAAFYKALKPGGMLGLVEHRADAKGKQDPEAKSGYVQQAYVLKLAKDAGFTVVAASEINANPKDTKDYEKGVWTLPPVLRLGDQDKAKYQAIGESDRMTLLFRKGN
jgi:predicted methyltransferase